MSTPGPSNSRVGVRRLIGAPGFVRAAFRLVLETNRALCGITVALCLVSAALTPAMAYLGKRILDQVARAAELGRGAVETSVLVSVGLFFGLAGLLVGAQRGLAVSDALLRVQLAQRVTEMVLRKAAELSLADFEDPKVGDRLERVARHAAERPLSLVRRALGVFEQLATVAGFTLLLLAFSPLMPLLLLAAALPALLLEFRYNADAFGLFRARSPAARRQAYLEALLTRSDPKKEVQLFGLGELFRARHREIFAETYAAERRLTLRRGFVGLLLGLLGSLAVALGFAWVVWAGARSRISVGEVAMLFVAIRQVQASALDAAILLAGMHEDHLYLKDLQELLGHRSTTPSGAALEGTRPGDGLRFENVSFTYPGADAPALADVSFHLPRGTTLGLVGENGAGKTTLIKLAVGLYSPSSGVVRYDGRDLRDWSPSAYFARVGVIFQDFVRYQLLAGENIGVGDLRFLDDEQRWAKAAHASTAARAIERLPSSYRTLLGRWFEAGQDLSVGEWQRVALARFFMRRDAELLVLDEPTASLDLEGERDVLAAAAELLRDRLAIVVSHREGPAKLANRVLTLNRGRVVSDRTTTP